MIFYVVRIPSRLCANMNFVAYVLLFLTAVFNKSNAAGIVFKETKSSGDDRTVCDVITSQEGKYTYKGGSLASACCTVGGLNDFRPSATSFTLKSTNKTKKAICCLTPGSRCSGRIKCCNNEQCSDSHVCTKIEPPGGTSVSVTLKRDNCTDQSKPYHIKISIKEKGRTFTGDGCCDTNKIHMIDYRDHCCSVSNSPIFITNRHNHLTPRCCNGQYSGPQIQISNSPSFSGKQVLNYGGITHFCLDNYSGAYNVTKTLSQIPEFRRPDIDNNQLKCCANSRKVKLGVSYCCENLTDRFKDVASQKKSCCVYDSSCHEGYPCCSGVCSVIRTYKEGDKDYGCKKGKDQLLLSVETCKRR